MAKKVSSLAFTPDGPIPAKHTGEGQDISPPLEWSELPEGTKEVALICNGPDAPTERPFVHWVVYKIPADQRGLPEGGAKEVLEGRNDFGGTGLRRLYAPGTTASTTTTSRSPPYRARCGPRPEQG
jgi:Raf kinase inhibitor-like YbhB/YbcL family protein